jgi:hypothetical protein
MKPLGWRLYHIHPTNFPLLLLLVPDFIRNNVMYWVCKKKNTGLQRLYPVHPGNFSLLLLLVPDFLRKNVMYMVCKY